MKLEIKKGTTSKLVEIFISDSSSTTGAGLAGVLYSDITAYYYRSGDAGATAITLATMTLGTWVSGGFIELDATNMPGRYQLGVPDAALATGVDQVGIDLKGATNMAYLPLEIQLNDNTEKDIYDIVTHASYGNDQLVRSTTPANTLDVSLTGEAGMDWANIGSPTSVVDFSGTTIKNITTNLDKTGYSLTQVFPGNFADMSITLTTGEVTVATNNDKTGYEIAGTKTTLDVLNDIDGSSVILAGVTHTGAVIPEVSVLTGHTAQTGDNFARIGAPVSTSISADIAIVDVNVDTLLARITSALFSGITSLAEWLGLVAGKQAGDATALAEIQATGAGSGTFDPTTDSNEAIRDTEPLGTAMRGTELAALAVNYTATRAGYMDNINNAALQSTSAQTGDSYSRLGAPAGLSVSADNAAIKSETALIKANTDNLPEGIQKNTALAGFPFEMILSTDHVSPGTGLTVTAQMMIDSAAYVNMTNAVVEIGSGTYTIDLAAADTNGDCITYKFTATGADATKISFKTEV